MPYQNVHCYRTENNGRLHVLCVCAYLGWYEWIWVNWNKCKYPLESNKQENKKKSWLWMLVRMFVIFGETRISVENCFPTKKPSWFVYHQPLLPENTLLPSWIFNIFARFSLFFSLPLSISCHFPARCSSFPERKCDLGREKRKRQNINSRTFRLSLERTFIFICSKLFALSFHADFFAFF